MDGPGANAQHITMLPTCLFLSFFHSFCLFVCSFVRLFLNHFCVFSFSFLVSFSSAAKVGQILVVKVGLAKVGRGQSGSCWRMPVHAGPCLGYVLALCAAQFRP